jgi:hypothetical protein
MKAKISIDITHTVREDRVPEMDFTRTSTFSLELPLGADAFLEAVEALTTNNLSNMLNRLCAKVIDDGKRYVEIMNKKVSQQPASPVGEQAALPPGEQAVLPAGEQGE